MTKKKSDWDRMIHTISKYFSLIDEGIKSIRQSIQTINKSTNNLNNSNNIIKAIKLPENPDELDANDFELI